MVKCIGAETGLPIEAAEKIKAAIGKLEEGNEELRKENEILRQRLSEIESGKLGAIKEDGSVKLIPNDQPIAELNFDGEFKPIRPNIMTIGTSDNYLNDVITANITVASSLADKEIIGDVDELFANIKLPKPRRYRRKLGKGDEIGFMAEEMPEVFRRGSGYDLKALMAYLAWKLSIIENSLQKR
ncbi:MAG: hypothetical protein QXW02_04345 [Nitrososphaerota archaeon]